MKVFIFILKVAVAVAVIWIIADKFSIEQFSYLLKQPIFLILPLFCWSLNLLLTCVRAFLLLKKDGYHVHFANMLRAHFSATFMGSVLPGVLGGDIVKAGYLFSYNKSFSKVKIASVLVFDRLFGIGAIIFWGAIFSLSFIVFRGGEVNLLSMTPVIFLLLGLLSFIAFRVAVRIVPDDKLPNLLRDLWSSFSTISDFKDLRYSIPVVASTLGAVFILLIGLATVGGILHTQVDGQSYFLIQLFLLSLSLFVSAIPITPLGVGVGQLTVSTVYAMYGLDPTVGVTVATIQQAGLLVVSVLIGGPAIFTIRKQ